MCPGCAAPALPEAVLARIGQEPTPEELTLRRALEEATALEAAARGIYEEETPVPRTPWPELMEAEREAWREATLRILRARAASSR